MYQDIVFMQGEEGREVVDKLCNVDGVVAHGATRESIERAIEHLSQWDFGDENPSPVVPAAVPLYDGDRDARMNGYVIVWNLGLGTVALYGIR